MTLTRRTTAATVVVAAIVVPYIGYLIAGSMPYVQDPTGMAAVGLIFGVTAALLAGRGSFAGPQGRPAAYAGVLALALGFATLIWGELGTTSEILLALFVLAVIGTWALAVPLQQHHDVRGRPVRH